MQNLGNVIGGLYEPYAFETLTVSNSVVPLTSSKYETNNPATNPMYQVQYVVITNETGDIRYTFDGTTPVGGSVGHLLTAGNALVLSGYSAIKKFQAIRNASTDATLQVTYER